MSQRERVDLSLSRRQVSSTCTRAQFWIRGLSRTGWLQFWIRGLSRTGWLNSKGAKLRRRAGPVDLEHGLGTAPGLLERRAGPVDHEHGLGTARSETGAESRSADLERDRSLRYRVYDLGGTRRQGRRVGLRISNATGPYAPASTTGNRCLPSRSKNDTAEYEPAPWRKGGGGSDAEFPWSRAAQFWIRGLSRTGWCRKRGPLTGIRKQR
jgi:hypothetical protein